MSLKRVSERRRRWDSVKDVCRGADRVRERLRVRGHHPAEPGELTLRGGGGGGGVKHFCHVMVIKEFHWVIKIPQMWANHTSAFSPDGCFLIGAAVIYSPLFSLSLCSLSVHHSQCSCPHTSAHSSQPGCCCWQNRSTFLSFLGQSLKLGGRSSPGNDAVGTCLAPV